MKDKLETIKKLFGENEIRSIWNNEKKEYFFSVVDVVGALTESSKPEKNWNDIKNKLLEEGSLLYKNIVQFKMKSNKDGKYYLTDTLDIKDIFRLIESIQSKKAKSFKVWLAHLGKEKIDELFDPSITIDRAINYYRNYGYDYEWIESKLKEILNNKVVNR